MKLTEDLLRRTLTNAVVGVTPPVIDDVRVAIARAERRRRLMAIVVTAIVLLVTLVMLYAVGLLRQP